MYYKKKKYAYISIRQNKNILIQKIIEMMQKFETHNVRKKEGRVLLHSQSYIYSIYWCWFTWACNICFKISTKHIFCYRVYTATTDKIPASTWIDIFSFIIILISKKLQDRWSSPDQLLTKSTWNHWITKCSTSGFVIIILGIYLASCLSAVYYYLSHNTGSIRFGGMGNITTPNTLIN